MINYKRTIGNLETLGQTNGGWHHCCETVFNPYTPKFLVDFNGLANDN